MVGLNCVIMIIVYGEEIVEVREALGLSRGHMAILMNVTEPTIHHWEHGHHSPTRYDHVILLQLYELQRNHIPRFQQIRHQIREALALDPEPERNPGISAAEALGAVATGAAIGFGLGMFMSLVFGPADANHDRRRR